MIEGGGKGGEGVIEGGGKGGGGKDWLLRILISATLLLLFTSKYFIKLSLSVSFSPSLCLPLCLYLPIFHFHPAFDSNF